MQKLVFEVEFLSDVVLPASSNTQGKIQHHDFIPGSNFLGMAAKAYGDFEDSFAVFHSAKVKFGDALLLHNQKQGYAVPLSFFHEKLDASVIYNHHLIEDFSSFVQLKQLRSGTITEDLQRVPLSYNYSQKSSYDKEHRKSKEGGMYGYRALSKGLRWIFTLTLDASISSHDKKLLIQSLCGEQRLGKSKSAEYARVKIVQSDKDTRLHEQESDMVLLYAKSRLALVDDKGNATLDVRYLFDGLTEENIDYAKTQIRTQSFTPYNSTRSGRDYERLVIDRGSVIVLKGIEKKNIPNFVGVYQNEGFGEVLLNPPFLLQNQFALTPAQEKQQIKPTTTPLKTPLVQLLQEKREKKLEKLKLLNKVDDFIDTHKKSFSNISSSQWGVIRSLTIYQDAKEKIQEYIAKGVKAWSTEQQKLLLDENHSIEFIKLLSINMPKAGDNND